MTSPERPDPSAQIDDLLETPELAEALASDRFKQFLDHIPLPILVSEIASGPETIVYVNHEAEAAVGLSAEAICGQEWPSLDTIWSGDGGLGLGAAILADRQPAGIFTRPPVEGETGPAAFEAQASLIADESGEERFRIVALIDVGDNDRTNRETFEARLRDKDLLLMEIQHRVRNNLQMITALIRMESRRAGDNIGEVVFERLAGRIEALSLLYDHLSPLEEVGTIDLGAFLSQIAGAVMRTHATEGVRLDLMVDVVETGINVAMPIGLLVNELMTNALKYAFEGRGEGVVSVRCLKENDACTVSVADDGVGMSADSIWPKPGKLGALIVRSLEDNTKAKIEATSKPGEGVSTRIRFDLKAPETKRA